ncbi:MAG: UPF0146 family protein [Halolamina sp.]
MKTAARDALRDRLADHHRLLEVAVGNRTDLAAALVAAGHDVLAVDVADCPVPEAVAFRRADVASLDPKAVGLRDAVYALNLPPELHRSTADLAAALGCPLLFTTLGFDEPTVPVARESLPAGETLYVHRPGAGPDG